MIRMDEDCALTTPKRRRPGRSDAFIFGGTTEIMKEIIGHSLGL
jgi:hypothetical protein